MVDVIAWSVVLIAFYIGCDLVLRCLALVGAGARRAERSEPPAPSKADPEAPDELPHFDPWLWWEDVRDDGERTVSGFYRG